MTPNKEGQKDQTFLTKFNHAVGVFVNGMEVTILVFCIAALGILLITNVFARTFFQSIYFAEEVSKFLVMLTTFTGVSYGVRKARHIRMGAFLDAMSPQLEKVFIIMISFISAIVMAIMAWFSYKYMMNAMQMGHVTPALRVPKWTFYIIIPVGFAMACLQYVRTIIKNLIEDGPWQSPDQQSEYEIEETAGPWQSPDQQSRIRGEETGGKTS